MKITNLFSLIIRGAVFFASFMLCILLLGDRGDILNKREAMQLRENAKVRCEETYENLTGCDRYRDATLMETVFVYLDVYDETMRPDVASIYSKYQLKDGTIEYVHSSISDMKGLGELADNSYTMQPFVEREEYYLDYKDAASTGSLRGQELNAVGDGVYYREGDVSAVYYFMVDVEE